MARLVLEGQWDYCVMAVCRVGAMIGSHERCPIGNAGCVCGQDSAEPRCLKIFTVVVAVVAPDE